MLLEGWDESLGQQGDAVLIALGVAHQNLPPGELDVLHAEADAFHDAHAGAIEQLSHELVEAGHLVEEPLRLVFGEHRGQATVFAGADGVDGAGEFNLEHMAIEKEEGAEGLVLGGRGHRLVDRQPGEKGLDLGRVQLARMAQLVKADVAFDPVDVGGFGADGIALEADGVAYLVEKLLGLGWHCELARKNRLADKRANENFCSVF